MDLHKTIYSSPSIKLLWQTIICTIFITDLVRALRLTRLVVPSAVIVGDPVWLNCSYDLENDGLYSIKWYKLTSGSRTFEFYRFLPNENPQIQIYNATGVYVDPQKSNLGNVYLWKTDLNSEGTYRCEILAESSFQTVHNQDEMKLYYLPEKGPIIISSRSNNYKINDLVNLTCETGLSKPKAELKWFINGKEAPLDYLRWKNDQFDFEKRNRLSKSSLSLEFYLRENDYDDGQVRLRCTAVIMQTFSTSSEEIIISDNNKPQYFTVHEGNGPVITGTKATYKLGDDVNLTCTSSKSKPSAEVNWYINDKLVIDNNILAVHPKVQFSDGNEITRVGLNFKLSENYFEKVYSSVSRLKSRPRKQDNSNKQLRIKCTSSLYKIINIGSVETIIANNHHLSGSRAEETKAGLEDEIGNNSNKSSCTSILIIIINAIFASYFHHILSFTSSSSSTFL